MQIMEKKSAIYLFFVAFILLKGTYTYAQRQSNHVNIHKNGKTIYAKNPEMEKIEETNDVLRQMVKTSSFRTKRQTTTKSIDKVQSGQN
jgi:hypothetical protein